MGSIQFIWVRPKAFDVGAAGFLVGFILNNSVIIKPETESLLSVPVFLRPQDIEDHGLKTAPSPRPVLQLNARLQ